MYMSVCLHVVALFKFTCSYLELNHLEITKSYIKEISIKAHFLNSLQIVLFLELTSVREEYTKVEIQRLVLSHIFIKEVVTGRTGRYLVRGGWRGG